MLKLEGVTLAMGGRDLLVGADLHVHPGDKIGLVGRNGTGKTTLLRAIVGEVLPDRGRVTLRGDAVIGWLPQTAVSGSTKTVWDEAKSQMASLDALRGRLEAAERAVERGDDGAIERLDEAQNAFRIAGGWAADERIGEVLHGLGFGPDEWKRTCDTFSGGWQMRIALARLLLSEPNLLLLDEPTNHLDLHARSWLARYLDGYPHAVLVVSHDRHLLDRVCKRIVELRGQELHAFTGNFTSWLRQREERIAQQQAAFESQQKEIARLERFVERFGAKATKASQAQSRQKVLDKMERIDAPEAESKPRLRLPPAPGASYDVITLEKAAVGYGETVVLRDVDLAIERGMRIAVLGPNGSGKSTLLGALSARLPLSAGRRKLGKDVRIGVFTQDLAQDLPADGAPVEVVLARAPRATPGQVRAALGALGLTGDAALRPIGVLSGGEKARVALASFAVQPFDVLLLDEPTNHLDAVTVDVLVEALSEYDGALVVVTHDRFLVEQVATHVVMVRDGRIELRQGVRPEDFDPVAPTRSSEASAAAGGADDHAARKKRARERDRALRRIEAVQQEIEALEARIAAVDERMIEVATNYPEVSALAAEREGLEAKLAASYAEWEQLEASLAAP
jgi:ATP-binding cassette subfamily F protein 3